MHRLEGEVQRLTLSAQASQEESLQLRKEALGARTDLDRARAEAQSLQWSRDALTAEHQVRTGRVI